MPGTMDYAGFVQVQSKSELVFPSKLSDCLIKLFSVCNIHALIVRTVIISIKLLCLISDPFRLNARRGVVDASPNRRNNTVVNTVLSLELLGQSGVEPGKRGQSASYHLGPVCTSS